MTRNEKEKKSFVYRSAVKHIFKSFTDNLLRRSSLWKSRGIIASLENGKSSAKCIPSPPPLRYSPYANDDAVCLNLFYPNSCTVYSLKLYSHGKRVCMHIQNPRGAERW